jgi:hypothetical protein
MIKDRLTTSPLMAAAAAVAATGFMVATPPAHALPPAPLAPNNCAQFEFNGPTNLKLSTGPILSFTANGPGVNGPATDNRQDQGNITGTIFPNRAIDLTYLTSSPQFAGDPPVHFVGNVRDDGTASGNFYAKVNGTWETGSPLGCPQQALAAKQGPTVDLDPGLGTLVIHVTDQSGVASNCQYHSDFVNRTFDLPANGTFDINVVPAVPLGIDHQVDITCTNGTSTHTTKFF